MKRGLLACLATINIGCSSIVTFLGGGYHARVDLTGDGRDEIVDFFPKDRGFEFTIRERGIDYKSDRFRALGENYQLVFRDFNRDGLMDVGLSNGRSLYGIYVGYNSSRKIFQMYKLPMQRVER